MTNRSTDSDNLIGKQINTFVILEEIGRGGMATVYRATQKSINRDVALKVLPRAFLHDPGFFERFEREVDVIAHLEHPHIVPIYDYGEFEGMPYIAMRYLSGGSLRKIIESGNPSLRDLIRPISQIAQALDHAHQQGIIHRDLKPGNILLDENRNAYLSDFGIARVLNSDLTGSAIIGTPAYMSPEQANGEMLDARADIYSLGIVIFELITGREPFRAETPIAMILKHINERVPLLSDFRDDIPREVDKVIAKATEKRPQDRYSSAMALAEAFEEAVRGTSSTVSIPTRGPKRSELSEAETLPPTKPEPAFEDLPEPRASKNLEGDTISPETGKPITSRNVIEAVGKQSSAAETQTRSSNRGWMFGITAVLIAVVVAVVFFITNSRPGAPDVIIPEPFTGAVTVQTDFYAVAIPQAWLPANGRQYNEEASDERPLHHFWSGGDGDTLVSLSISGPQENIEFRDAVNDYSQRYYDSRTDLEKIDEVASPNGVFRRSYRVNGMGDVPSGQIDVFYEQRGDRVIAIEMYSSDAVGNDAVQTFQNILDSFRFLQA